MGKRYVAYNAVHSALQTISKPIQDLFNPEAIIGIGGGGYIPSRIIRTWLRIPIYGVNIQLYDDKTDKVLEGGPQKSQWLDDIALKKLVGKRVLLMDEVDDTRTTLCYCVDELKKAGITEIAVLVLHNKRKPKKGFLDVDCYFACCEVDGDEWIVYPWEANNIDEHQLVVRMETK